MHESHLVPCTHSVLHSQSPLDGSHDHSVVVVVIAVSLALSISLRVAIGLHSHFEQPSGLLADKLK